MEPKCSSGSSWGGAISHVPPALLQHRFGDSGSPWSAWGQGAAISHSTERQGEKIPPLLLLNPQPCRITRAWLFPESLPRTSSLLKKNVTFHPKPRCL